MSPNKARRFDPKIFLAQTGLGRTLLRCPKNKVIFSQGEPSDAVFYIQTGRVKVTVLSSRGKEATIALMGDGDFIGEECIASDQPLRTTFATAITDCSVLRIEREAILKVLHREHAFSDLLVAYLVRRYNQTREDLVDQLFQLCGEAVGSDSFAAGPLWEGTANGERSSKNKPGNFGGNGRNNSGTSELFYESIQTTGPHRL